LAYAGRRWFALYGRDGELAAIAHAMASAQAGHASALALVGEPGIGKSRLASEAVRAPMDVRVVPEGVR
jgi:predicted ATPase